MTITLTNALAIYHHIQHVQRNRKGRESTA